MNFSTQERVFSAMPARHQHCGRVHPFQLEQIYPTCSFLGENAKPDTRVNLLMELSWFIKKGIQVPFASSLHSDCHWRKCLIY